jgi:hypothetical protein
MFTSNKYAANMVPCNAAFGVQSGYTRDNLPNIVADNTDLGRRQSKPVRCVGPFGGRTMQNDAFLMRIVTRRARNSVSRHQG